MNKFNDFSDEKFLTGQNIKFEDVFGAEIIVQGVHFGDSKHNGKPAAKIQFIKDGITYISWTQSAPMLRQLHDAVRKNMLPFSTTPTKENAYYTFT
ncbi:MAG: hypothetical protein PHC50_04355 [Candidatus Cloacimonetes bacterium]|nr:hypothetical protein [Candidatus Cloacimonadota bacterium]